MPVIAPVEGISGSSNQSGQVRKEENPKLQGASAYGVPGSLTWGEWERILRTDPDLNTAVEFVKSSIRDCRVSVEEASEESQPDRALAKAQAEFIRWCLLEKTAPGWSELKNQMVSSLVPGFGLWEECWGVVKHKSLPNGTGYGITEFSECLPSSIHVNGWIEENGELAGVRQTGQKRDGSWGEVILPAGKLMLFSWNRSGQNYLGFSAFRAVWYLCRIRVELLKLVGISLSREGAGIPVAYSLSDNSAPLDAQQRADLEQLLANVQYHEKASLIAPVGWKVDWLFSPGANKGHVLDAWAQLGKAILRQVFAMQLSLGADATSGSRAVGEVHDATADAFVGGVLSAMEGVFNGTGDRPYEGSIRKMCLKNWGAQEGGFPKLKLEVKQVKIPVLERARAIQTLVAAGSLTPTHEDENVHREALGLPPISEEDRSDADVSPVPFNGLQVEAATSVIESIKAGRIPRDTARKMFITFFGISDEAAAVLVADIDPDPLPSPEDMAKAVESPKVKPTKKVPTSEKKPKAFAAAGDAFVPTRALRFAEKRLDLQGQAKFLDEARVRFETRVKPAAAHMLFEAIPAVRERMADGDATDVGAIELNTELLEKVIGDFLNEARVEGARQVRAETAKGAALRIAKERGDGHVMAAGDEKDPPPTPPQNDQDEETDALIEAQKEAAVRRIKNRISQDLENEAIHALRTGADADEVIQRVVSRQVETGAFKGDAGMITTTAWNLGRNEAAEKMGGFDVVQYSCILDKNTCDNCRELDGQEWAFNSPEHDAHLPPNRDCDGWGNCRCMLIPLKREDAGADE